MKRAWVLLLVTVAIAGTAMGQTSRPDSETAKAMANLAAQTRNTLCIVELTIKDEMINSPTGTAPVFGMGICVKVEGDKATLITTALDPRISPKSVKKDGVQVTVPGGEKKLTGAYLSTDPQTGITFVTVTDATYKWQAVRFAEKPELGVGKQVFSVGLLEPWLGYEPYVGTAFVSAKVRVPGPMIYCTGGALTNVGSPVLTADGTAVGIILQQLPNTVTLSGVQQPINLSAQRESSCFVPSDEFGAIINNPPATPKPLPWIGVLGWEPVPAELNLTYTAVRVVRVAPNSTTLSSPAARAGLKDKEIIKGIDGLAIEKFPTPEMTLNNFLRVINRMPAGSKLKLNVMDREKPVELDVEAFPPAPRDAAKYKHMALGMIVRDKVALDEALDTTATAKEKGVYVVSVFGPDSPAALAGLKGEPDFHLITKVMLQPVTSVAEFQAIVEKELSGGLKPINMVVSKGASTENIVVKPVTKAP